MVRIPSPAPVFISNSKTCLASSGRFITQPILRVHDGFTIKPRSCVPDSSVSRQAVHFLRRADFLPLRLWPPTHTGPVLIAPIALGEIGRASCRARVCQYV